MAGSLVHCHLHACPGGLLQLECPQIWTSTALLLGAACSQLSLCAMWTSTALQRTCGQLRPTGTVLNVHCPAVSSGPAGNWYCAPCGPALPHDRELGPLLRTCLPGWATPIRAPQIWTSTALLLGEACTVFNVDQHCPMTGSLVHCHLRAWAIPIRAPQIWTSTALLLGAACG